MQPLTLPGAKPRSRTAWRRLLLAGLPVILALLACSTLLPLDPNEQALQGSWTQTMDQGDGHTSFLTWTFDHGRFEVQGYPPLYQTGHYEVVDRHANGLVLRLYDQSGDWPTAERQVTIVLAEDGQSLTMDGGEPFFRITPP